MKIPMLEPTERSREFNKYSQEEKDKIVYYYLFDGLSHRDLDSTILNLNSEQTKGWQSMGILHHLGLMKNFKGIFNGVSELNVIQELQKTNSENYNWLIEYIKRYITNGYEIGIFDSWQIVSNTVALKTTDKSVFEHHGSGIPKDTRRFWTMDKLSEGTTYPIILIYKDIKYDAYFQRESNEPYRTRLFWHFDLLEKIRKTFPHYKEFEKDKINYPIMRFEKVTEDTYLINFIVPEYINVDIESESEEAIQSTSIVGNKEGKSTYFYSKKYERNTKNRIEAIKIHGTKCICCGFDFEKIYGERGVGYIEIHHKNPLYNIEDEVIINPKDDLVPVCANCHRIIHRKKDDVLTVEEVRAFINKYK